MKRNMGTLDKIIRVLAALLIAVLYFTHQIGGVLALVLGLIAVIFIITGFLGFCPIYFLFGINTRKINKQ